MAALTPKTAHGELCDDIEATINPYLESDTEPPFSVEELAVMAAVINPDKCWRPMFSWVLEEFRYWRVQAVDFAAFGEDSAYSHDIEIIRREFKRALTSLEVPTQRNSTRPVSTYDDAGFNDATWPVSTAAARAFLGLCNIPPIPASRMPNLSAQVRNAKQFRFLDLPAELREKIYEYALELPASGVAFETMPQRKESGRGPRLIAQTKSLTSTTETSNWFPSDFDPSSMSMQIDIGEPKSWIEGEHLSRHLALTRVNRQVSEESLAYFYKHTHFVFRTFDDLQEFLDKTPKARRDMIRHMSFILHPREHRIHNGNLCTKVGVTMKTLKGMKALRELGIWIYSDVFGSVLTRGLHWGKKWGDLATFPGVVGLRAMRGLQKVTVHGDCNRIRGILETEMVIQKEGKKKRVSRKRVADGEAEDEEKPRASKKKA